jgi:hypothetical protein
MQLQVAAIDYESAVSPARRRPIAAYRPRGRDRKLNEMADEAAHAMNL